MVVGGGGEGGSPVRIVKVSYPEQGPKVRRELADLSLDLYNTGVDPMSNLRNRAEPREPVYGQT